MNEYEKLKELAKNYLSARHTFLYASQELPDLTGNDNIVGRIGELIAIQFLRDRGRTVIKNKNPVQKGFDLITIDGAQISVKIITAENKSGRTSKLKQPWSEFILIKLNSKYKVEVIGIINNVGFNKAIKSDLVKAAEPYTDVKMLLPKGLFDKYGKLYKDKDVAHYL